MNIRDKIFNEISKERDRQDKKWGEQNHDILQWFSIIDEERGEISKAWNEYAFDNHLIHIKEIKTEAIQTCACIVAMLESMERNEDKHENKIKEKMMQNSLTWLKTNDTAEKATLALENQKLGKSIGSTFDCITGWWTDRNGNLI